jgi:hypothetical protein
MQTGVCGGIRDKQLFNSKETWITDGESGILQAIRHGTSNLNL